MEALKCAIMDTQPHLNVLDSGATLRRAKLDVPIEGDVADVIAWVVHGITQGLQATMFVKCVYMSSQKQGRTFVVINSKDLIQVYISISA